MGTESRAPVCAYIGLGSNLDTPVAQLRRALGELDALPASRLVAHSSLYSNPPMGPADQPAYVNAVAALRTSLAPLALLDALQALEQAHGRVRGPQRWGPRTLDLDLLLFDDLVRACPRLTLPHPGLAERAFVVLPLMEIAPALVLPDGRALAEVARGHDPSSLHRLDDAA